VAVEASAGHADPASALGGAAEQGTQSFAVQLASLGLPRRGRPLGPVATPASGLGTEEPSASSMRRLARIASHQVLVVAT
jgi:hypothetical protein